MKQVGVFIEPKGSLAATIRALKAKAELRLPGQKFCSHPLHSTLICGRYCEPNKWRAQMGAVLARQPSFRIQTRDFHLFFEDPRADGGHTFVFKVQPTPAIFSLQQSCSDVLKLWRTRNETGENDGLIECEPFRSSFLQYGFPFVGSFWIPHFTVASLKIPRASPLLREFSSHESRHEFTLEKVSVWEIDGDSHKKLFELPLGGIIKGE